MSSVHFGRKPNRKRVCGSLNRTSQNHYVSEPNRTGTGQNHALILLCHKNHYKRPKDSSFSKLFFSFTICFGGRKLVFLARRSLPGFKHYKYINWEDRKCIVTIWIGNMAGMKRLRVCLFVFFWLHYLSVYFVVCFGQLSHFFSYFGSSVRYLNAPPLNGSCLPIIAIRSWFHPFRVIANKKQ